MTIQMVKKSMKVICFDLDDTLQKEINYLYMAYRHIAEVLWGDNWEQYYKNMLSWYEAKENVFEKICAMCPSVELGGLLSMYRYEIQNQVLPSTVEEVLQFLKDAGCKLGLITDGRELTQNNKIKALGLDRYFDKDMIIISETFGSEKPCEKNYLYFMQKLPECKDFTYVGDNPKKDFVAANRLGWNTVCLLDDGRNIHKQDFNLAEEYLPKMKINSLKELIV